MPNRLISASFLSLILLVTNAQADPAVSAFTFQGQLKDATSPASGTYDLTFSLFDASTAGNQIGTTLTNASINVSNGLFTTTLDFGSLAFSNSVRYLEISVRTNASSGAFTTLAPRQSITPAPTAIYAAQATSLNAPLPDAQLSANIPRLNSNETFSGTVTFSSASGNFAGNGFNLTNLSAFKLIGIAPDAVLSANIPRLDAANNNFAGTLSSSDAKIGQYHTLTANRSSIFGGYGNVLSGPGWDSAIVGGQGNFIVGSDPYYFSTMLGGYANSISNGNSSTVIGGYGNNLTNAWYSSIIGGQGNTISGNGQNSSILGGQANTIRGDASSSSILGGYFNTINAPNAIVGGFHAAASNSYSFVWADASSASDFATTASHQFLIRAINGVGINTNNPASALHVNGTITANALNLNGAINATAINLNGAVSAPSLNVSNSVQAGSFQYSGPGTSLITDHLRLGALVNTTSNAPGYGKALIFSGAPDVSTSWNNDNSDPIWMARYNAGDNQSQLRLILGDDSGVDDKFLIGITSGGGADFNPAGAWTPKFSVDSSGTVRAAGTFVANTSPDLAETIPAADNVEAGDIVCADPNRREHAIRCAKGDRAILGVISDASGGFLINANGGSPTAALTGKPLVLTGRVPVKVSLENGPIKIGDTLTPSSVPGVAMRATQPGPAVGIALDEYNGSENGNEIGKVLCFVKVGDVNTATVLHQLNADTTRLEKMLTDRDARIAALEKAVTALQQAIQSK